MRLLAILCWWHERPDWLRDVIHGLKLAQVDQLVAVDGSYEHFPDGTPQSGDEEVEAILTGAHDTGIGCDLYQPERLWPTEPVKRTYAFRMADVHKPDWLLVIDADEVIIAAPPDLKDRLAAAEQDMADVCSLDQPSSVLAAGFLESEELPSVMLSRCVMPRRCLFRWTPGIRVGLRHFDYLTPDGRNLWGDQYGHPLRVRDMVIDHRHPHRDKARAQAADGYRQVRDDLEIEGVPTSAVWDPERERRRRDRAAELDAKLAAVLERA